jgi:FixJ family two-component response regulator
VSGPPLVFVVDDEEPVRDALRRLCTSLGYAVEVFPNAEALFDSRRLHAATCVVLDLQLPGLNGLDVQRRLAEIGAHLQIGATSQCRSRRSRRAQSNS